MKYTRPEGQEVLAFLRKSEELMFKSSYRILRKKSDLAEKIDYGVAAVGAPQAWKETQGEGVTVMVLDTGITKGHPTVYS